MPFVIFVLEELPDGRVHIGRSGFGDIGEGSPLQMLSNAILRGLEDVQKEVAERAGNEMP